MKRLHVWSALLCAGITLVLWSSAFLYYQGRQEAALAQWNALQHTLVSNAGQSIRIWFEARLSQPGAQVAEIQDEALLYYVAPMPLLPGSTAWAFANQNLLFYQGPGFDAGALGEAVSDLFAARQKLGAAHFDGLVASVQAAGQGADWYTWLPQVGREAAAWISIQVGAETWTIGLSTPETQILAAFGAQADLQRELFGVGTITLLVWGMYLSLLRQRVKAEKQVGARVEPANVDLQASTPGPLNPDGESAAVRDEFLATMSHELRTPLNTINGLAYALQCQVYGPVTEKQGHSLETILVTSQHLSALIDNLLDLSKIQAGTLKIDLKPVEVHALLESSLSLVDGQARAKHIQLQVEEGDAPVVVEADEARLRQVLVSLLGNAIKFTPAGGQVGMRSRADAESQCLRLSIWDTGIGIACDDMRRLFRPFVQLDSGTARLQNGSGLGLALAARIIKMHGGCLELESQPGKGSQVSAVLPWRVDAAQSSPNEAVDCLHSLEAGMPAKAVQRLLIVDDDRRSAQLLKDFLMAAGCEVQTEYGAEEAVRACKTRRPDLILINVPLAGTDGFDAGRALRAVPGCEDVPLIALCSVCIPGDEQRSREAGVDEMIRRPVRLDKMAQLILRLTAGRPALRGEHA